MIETMKKSSHDLLVMFRHNFLDQRSVQQEVESIDRILHQAASTTQFCTAHELVDRNYITSKAKRILRATRNAELRPFRFLINKN